MLEHNTTSRRSVVLDDPPDHEVIERVRAGDTTAYDVIYRRHRDAVHRLARRYAKHASEADDVTSEVFAKTLRAITHGHGPTDDAGPYLLRSVRNTVTSLRLGADARTIPTDDDHLDRPGAPISARCDDDDVSLAFLDLPDRYRDVLWATVVEGRGPADMADGSIDAGAVASLTHRARFALRRSYLVSSTRRRCVVEACREIRQLMPGAALGQAAAATCGRIDDHALTCADCAEVRDDMERLAQQMPARSLLGLLGAWWARIGASAAQLAGSAAPVLAPAIAATVGVAVTMVAASSGDIDRPVTTSSAIEIAESVETTDTDASGRSDVSDAHDTPAEAPAPPTGTDRSDGIDEPSPSGALDPVAPPSGAKSARRPIIGVVAVAVGGGGGETAAIPATGGGDVDGSGPLDGAESTLPVLDPRDPSGGPTGQVAGTLGEVVDDLVGSGGLVDGAVVGAVDGLVDGVVEPVLAGTGQLLGSATGTLGGVVDSTVDDVAATVQTPTETVNEVVATASSTIGDAVETIGAGTTVVSTVTAPLPTVPIEPVADDLVATTESVTGTTGTTLDSVTETLTGLLGR
jgi:RNA polymerase sigma factor (sigma-70 family)